MNPYLSYLMFKEFCHCPECFSDSLGTNKGTFIINTNHFERACVCGFHMKMTTEEALNYFKMKGGD